MLTTKNGWTRSTKTGKHIKKNHLMMTIREKAAGPDANVHDSVMFKSIHDKVKTAFPEIKYVVADASYKITYICKQILHDHRVPVLPYKRPRLSENGDMACVGELFGYCGRFLLHTSGKSNLSGTRGDR